MKTKKTKQNPPLYALLVDNNKLRSSFWDSLEIALEKANYYLGVTGIENMETGKLEYIRDLESWEMVKAS